jgi:hypothetical protein
MIAMTAIPMIQPPPYRRYATLSHLNVLSPCHRLTIAGPGVVGFPIEMEYFQMALSVS